MRGFGAVFAAIGIAAGSILGCREDPQAASAYALPIPDSLEARHHGAVVISLPDSGGLLLNGHPIALQELSRQLRVIYQPRARDQWVVFFEIGPNRPTRQVMDVVEIVRREGFQVFDGVKSGYIVPEDIVELRDSAA